jgi:leucyl-tRNA synthetase
VVQGLVKGRTLVLKENGKYISQRDVDEGKYSMEEVRVTYEKMSKSKFNGLNPNILVDKYGSDALRTAIFFANPPDRDIDFS